MHEALVFIQRSVFFNRPKMIDCAKHINNSIEGYTHEVSGILDAASTSKYFMAVIQEARVFSTVIVFQVEHQAYSLTEKHREIVIKLYQNGQFQYNV